ncbi:MAG: hypothetical protein AB7L09_02570 [Nitrospira sp.]
MSIPDALYALRESIESLLLGPVHNYYNNLSKQPSAPTSRPPQPIDSYPIKIKTAGGGSLSVWVRGDRERILLTYHGSDIVIPKDQVMVLLKALNQAFILDMLEEA